MSKIHIAEDQLPGSMAAYDKLPGSLQPIFNWNINKWHSQKFHKNTSNNWSVAPMETGNKLHVTSRISDAYLRLLERHRSGTMLISWYITSRISSRILYRVGLTFFHNEREFPIMHVPNWFPVKILNKENALLLSIMHA